MKYTKKIIILVTFFVLISSIIFAQDYLTYRVKKGDSLSIIAQGFKVKLSDLIAINEIKNPDLIHTGQKLLIPKENSSYIVKKGESLSKIASRLKVNLPNLIKINQIKNPDLVYVGQKLVIPSSGQTREYQLASRSNAISYIWPIQGRITSEYGWRIHPVYQRREFHTGIDIAVPIGCPVYAAAAGQVIYSGYLGGYGNLVILKHRDNSKTYYGHNIELLVKKGDIIKKGKVIALSGSTGVSTGPHLHFEIRINGKHCNPLNYLNQRYLNNGFRI